MALMQQNSWDVHRFSRDTMENRMEGVCSPAASFSRAENWTFLCAKSLAQAEELGICSGKLELSPGHTAWAAPSTLCSKRSLGAVDSVLQNWESSEGEGGVRRS